MKEAIKYLMVLESMDTRQTGKVLHKLSEIIGMSLFAMIANADEGEKIKKVLGLDGKTQRGNGTEEQKANHIVSAVDENGICLSEVRVDDKSNEITAIPELLDTLNIKGNIVTADAMGTQKEIVKKSVKRCGLCIFA